MCCRSSHWRQWGVIYWSPWIYRLAMRLLRGKSRVTIFRWISQEVDRRSVLDLCCGDGRLQKFIVGRYNGIDLNPRMTGDPGDILQKEWPSAEVIVMVDSLYHFYERLDDLKKRLMNHRSKTVIICEPVNNLIPRVHGVLRKILVHLTRVEGKSYSFRFDPQNLSELLREWGVQRMYRLGDHLFGVLQKHD